jgi:hypothetical protein
MDLLGIKKLQLKNREVSIKLTNKALYRTQLDLKKEGLTEILTALDKFDYRVIFSLIKNSCVESVKEEEIIDADLDMISIIEFFANAIVVMFNTNVKKEDVVEKK